MARIETVEVENPLQRIADNFEARAILGLVEAKDLKRFYNKASKMFNAGEITKDEYRQHLKAILEGEYSSENLKPDRYKVAAFTARSQIHKELQKMLENKNQITQAVPSSETVAPQVVQVNYSFVSKKIEMNEPIKVEHIAGALTTLHVDLNAEKIAPEEAQYHLNSYTSLELPENSMEAKIRAQLLQSYSTNFEDKGVKVSMPSARRQESLQLH